VLPLGQRGAGARVRPHRPGPAPGGAVPAGRRRPDPVPRGAALVEPLRERRLRPGTVRRPGQRLGVPAPPGRSGYGLTGPSYLAYPEVDARRQELSCTDCRILLPVARPAPRAF